MDSLPQIQETVTAECLVTHKIHQSLGGMSRPSQGSTPIFQLIDKSLIIILTKI